MVRTHTFLTTTIQISIAPTISTHKTNWLLILLENKGLVKLPPKLTLLCAECHTPFEKIGWIIGARAGIGGIPGYAWYYVKCPTCGKRHWNKLIHLEIGKRPQ
ncbi:MAG: hypothetical protein ABSF63_05440 [Candidatus Bathyarchaeia archaeon]